MGADSLFHSCVCILATFGLLRVVGGTPVTTAIVFVFQMVYLFIGE